MAKGLNEIERAWMLKQLGSALYSSITPFNDIKRAFYISVLGANSERKSLGDMEKVWLVAAVTAAGATPVHFEKSDLWKELNAAEGFRISTSTDENKMTYYLNK
jgi:hypothetical protein